MPAFLKSIAEYYIADSPGRTPLENVVFVLPNKRSSMFLKYAVRECVNGVRLMPRFMTLPTFAGIVADVPEADSRELLFMLYTAYRDVMHARGRSEDVRDFDNFVFWGDMMLSDFEDVDRSMTNPDELFRNLRKVKSFQADFLSEEQKEIVRRVWGESRLTARVDTFWIHTSSDEEEAGDMPLARKFIYLWEVMADIYHRFHAILDEHGVASPAKRLRMALDKLEAIGIDDAPTDVHYVFVGFNDLSTVETLIFDRLKELNIASFFWDTAPLSLLDPDAPAHSIPAPLQRLRKLAKAYPMPADYNLPPATPPKEIIVSAVPSNSGQAKMLYPILSKVTAKSDLRNPADTVVVLPDQGLLVPALMSIPQSIKDINVSMALPYRVTNFASLLRAIISMQLRGRNIKGEYYFFYEDVLAVLTHPHLRAIAAEEAETLQKLIDKEKLFNVPAVLFAAERYGLGAIFMPVQSLTEVNDVADYLLNMLAFLGERLSTVTSNGARFELKALAHFSEEIEALADLCRRYNVSMVQNTFLHLFERMFNSRALEAGGKPLEGLQILGVLETRSVDFDNVVVLSMNERIFPKRQYSHTMIPGALRHGFGLPDLESLEWTYAYSFYRLIARAKTVNLLYDSRPEGRGMGEMSRYILQMRYLMPSLKVTMQDISYLNDSALTSTYVVEKTPEVQKQLAEFLQGGSKRLSATALKKFKKCGIAFYIEYVRSLREPNEMTDYITYSEFGTVVHNTIQALYAGNENCLIDSAFFERWLAPGSKKIEEAARRQILDVTKKKEGSAEFDIAVELVSKMVRINLENEREFYCSEGRTFTFIANEMKVTPDKHGVWKLADDLAVNFYMSIDRVDRLDAKHYRFIDYKTGSDEICAQNMDEVFTEDKKGGMFQLLTYAQAFRDMVDPEAEVSTFIHPLRTFAVGKGLSHMEIDEAKVERFSDYEADFRPRLVEMVRRIFDPSEPFTQSPDVDDCAYCQFRGMCGRFKSDN